MAKSILIGGAVFALSLIANLEAFGYVLSGMLGLAMLLLFGASLFCLLWGFKRPDRRLIHRAGALLVAICAAHLISGRVRSSQELASIHAADDLGTMLDTYRNSKGSYPDALDDLVPIYADGIPKSSMGLLRKRPFGYTQTEGGSAYLLSFESTGFVHLVRNQDGVWLRD